MQTETIQIEITGLPLGTKSALEEVGRSRGKNFADYLRDLIQTDLSGQNDIAQMAADPQIQAELRAIEQEFADLEISDIPVETFEALGELAQQNGKSPATFVREMIEVEVLAAKPFDEILAPIRQGFAASGMTGEEAEDFLAEQLQQHRAERRAKAQGPTIEIHPASSVIA